MSATRRLSLVVLVTTVVLAACDGSPPAETDGEASATPSDSSGPAVQGHILYSRITGTDAAEFFVANPDGSDETPFAPGKARSDLPTGATACKPATSSSIRRAPRTS